MVGGKGEGSESPRVSQPLGPDFLAALGGLRWPLHLTHRRWDSKDGPRPTGWAMGPYPPPSPGHRPRCRRRRGGGRRGHCAPAPAAAALPRRGRRVGSHENKPHHTHNRGEFCGSWNSDPLKKVFRMTTSVGGGGRLVGQHPCETGWGLVGCNVFGIIKFWYDRARKGLLDALRQPHTGNENTRGLTQDSLKTQSEEENKRY